MGCAQGKSNRFASGEGLPGLFQKKKNGAGAEQLPEFKVVLLGDCATGKSSIALRFIQDKFSDKHQVTIGAAFAAKNVEINYPEPNSPKLEIRLQIWDTAGEEKYRAMTRFYFRKSTVGILVYDVTDPKTFTNLTRWQQDFFDHCPDAKVILCGNKSDLESKVPASDAMAWAKQYGHDCVICSAKNGEGVERIFNIAAKRCAEQM